MKPKEYKNISMKEKQEIKTQYEFEKKRREFYEEEINNLEAMVPLDINFKFCLDRKLLDSFNEDEETVYEEEMELEENMNK